MEHKKKERFSEDGWELVPTDLDSTPQQQNGSDCGVFSCMFADFLSLNKVRSGSTFIFAPAAGVHHLY